MTPITFRPAFVFFPFSILFIALYIGLGHQEVFLAGLSYSALLGYRLKGEMRPRDAFPFVMLFLFSVGLALTPARGFSESLTRTVQLLIVFRGLLLMLRQVQNQKQKFDRADGSFALAFLIEVLLLLGLLFATFKPYPIEMVQGARLLSVRLFSVLGLFFTPLFIPAIILLPALFFPQSTPWVLIGIAVMEMIQKLKVKA